MTPIERHRAKRPRTLRNAVLAEWDRADLSHHADGRVWYERAHEIAREIGAACGGTVETGAGILAALSPMEPWERNVEMARACGDGAETLPTLGQNVDKALRIRAGESPRAVLGFEPKCRTGRKVRAFYSLILDPSDSETVCVDRHAGAIALREPNVSVVYAYLRRVSAYDQIARGYRAVARYLGVAPHVVQAVAWCSWRARPISERV